MVARGGLRHDGADGQEKPCRIISANSRVRARCVRRRHGVGRISVRPGCRCGGRRTSHATGGVGEPVVRERGDDHVSHDRARCWGGDFPASVSPPARRRGGGSPDRTEDLFRHRRDATRLEPARPMEDGRGFPGWRLHPALHPRWPRSLSVDRRGSVHLFRHRDQRTVRVGGRSPGTHPRRARCFRRIGGIRSTTADDRGHPADCFRASGDSAQTACRVEWCFSRSGLLLYLFDGVEGRRVTAVEATDVSEVVSDGDFVVAPT